MTLLLSKLGLSEKPAAMMTGSADMSYSTILANKEQQDTRASAVLVALLASITAAVIRKSVLPLGAIALAAGSWSILARLTQRRSLKAA
jgi:hypothetical protein